MKTTHYNTLTHLLFLSNETNNKGTKYSIERGRFLYKRETCHPCNNHYTHFIFIHIQES